jgi:hypothetical protein
MADTCVNTHTHTHTHTHTLTQTQTHCVRRIQGRRASLEGSEREWPLANAPHFPAPSHPPRWESMRPTTVVAKGNLRETIDFGHLVTGSTG